MYKPIRNIFILVIGIAVIFVAGCAEQKPPTFKESRAIAAENIALSKKVNRLNSQIEAMKKQHEQERKQQEEALAMITEERNILKIKAESNIKDQVKGILGAVLDDNSRLREENKQLKAQIEKLGTESGESEESM